MKEFTKILRLFLIWRIGLFVIAFLAPFFINDYGARFPYFNELAASGLPSWVWSFAGFDGVYYLRIAQNGYADQYSQAFFPLFPILINFLNIGGGLLLIALVISNLFFLGFLFVFYKLLRLDFSEKTAFKSLILLLTFPTAFYFGAVYSESLFFFLTASSILLVRKKYFIAGGLLAALASITKIFGLLLLIYIVTEIFLSWRKKEIKWRQILEGISGALLAPLGLLLYMYYLKVVFNNPLYFLTSQPEFGAGRSSEQFILLPQVLFRYFKILTTVPMNTLPYLNAALELIFTLIPLLLLIIYFKRIRLSYWLFMMGCLILPTMTGTFSSMPRYILTSFLMLPVVAELPEKYFKLVFSIFIVLAIILISLYTRGYWVA